MSKLEVYSNEDAFRLAQQINDLPGNYEVISCYKHGAAHWAWVRKVSDQTPPVSLEVPEIKKPNNKIKR